ncbi:hypothetical protein V7121_24475 [Neobacillus drentensis]
MQKTILSLNIIKLQESTSSKDSWFEHIAITAGSPEWLETVSDEEYNKNSTFNCFGCVCGFRKKFFSITL